MKVFLLISCLLVAVSAQAGFSSRGGIFTFPQQQQQSLVQNLGFRGPQYLPRQQQQQQQQQPIYNPQYKNIYTYAAPQTSQPQLAPNFRNSPVRPAVIPVVTASGNLADTPEVVAAKALHFSLYAQQAAAAASAKDDSIQFQQEIRFLPIPQPQQVGFHPVQSYSFQNLAGKRRRRSIENQHVPVLNHHGVPIETPEVLLAKSQHLLAHQAQNQHQAVGVQIPHSYQSHIPHQHVPILTAQGVPVDTPEVQKARAEHLTAHALAKSRNQGHHFEYDYNVDHIQPVIVNKLQPVYQNGEHNHEHHKEHDENIEYAYNHSHQEYHPELYHHFINQHPESLAYEYEIQHPEQPHRFNEYHYEHQIHHAY